MPQFTLSDQLATLADQLKLKGNEAFKASDLKEAIRLYTKAKSFLEESGEADKHEALLSGLCLNLSLVQ